MKVFNLILITLFLFLFQSTIAQNMRFSFVASPGIKWLGQTDNKSESKGTIIGINTGIVTDFFFTDKYAFSTGIMLSQSGGKLSYSDSISIDTDDELIRVPPETIINYKFQYLGVPIGLKFKTIEIGYMTYWLNPGLTPMVNIGSRGNTDNNLLEKQNLKNETALFNLDYFFKAGFEYSLGGETALLGGLAFNSSFIDMTKRSDDNVNSKSVSLILGILF